MHRLIIIVASTRPGRVGRQIADWYVAQATNHGGFEVEIIDLAQINLPFLDEPGEPADRLYQHQHSLAWSASVDAADAFTFVMPEYNSGYNAPLKNAIDYLYHEWHDKPVALVCYGMSSAGLRAAQMIKSVVSAVKMVPITPIVSIPLRQHLDSNGALIVSEQMNRQAGAMLDELDRLTRALATARQPNLPGSRKVHP